MLHFHKRERCIYSTRGAGQPDDVEGTCSTSLWFPATSFAYLIAVPSTMWLTDSAEPNSVQTIAFIHLDAIKPALVIELAKHLDARAQRVSPPGIRKREVAPVNRCLE
jgi:hypothetical protein